MDSKRHFSQPPTSLARFHSSRGTHGLWMPRTEPTPIPPKGRMLFGWRSDVQQQRSSTRSHRITKPDNLIRQRLTQTLEILVDIPSCLRRDSVNGCLEGARSTFVLLLVSVEVVEDFFLFLHLLDPGTWSRDGTWMGYAKATKLWANALYHVPRTRSRGLGGAAKSVDTGEAVSNENRQHFILTIQFAKVHFSKARTAEVVFIPWKSTTTRELS